MKAKNILSENQKRLLRRCPRWGLFRAGEARCEGYRHAIGANNGLMGLVRVGLITRGIANDGGNLFQMIQAGRDALADMDGADGSQ